MELSDCDAPLDLDVLVVGHVGNEEVVGVVGVEFTFHDHAYIGVQVGLALLSPTVRFNGPIERRRRGTGSEIKVGFGYSGGVRMAVGATNRVRKRQVK